MCVHLCVHVCCLGRSENFLLLRDVLQRVGIQRDKFMSTYANEVVVHEIGQKVFDQQLLATDGEDAATMKKSTTSSAAHVEFVRMSDAIRRLLNIDISVISVMRCNNQSVTSMTNS